MDSTKTGQKNLQINLIENDENAGGGGGKMNDAK